MPDPKPEDQDLNQLFERALRRLRSAEGAPPSTVAVPLPEDAPFVPPPPPPVTTADPAEALASLRKDVGAVAEAVAKLAAAQATEARSEAAASALASGELSARLAEACGRLDVCEELARRRTEESEDRLRPLVSAFEERVAAVVRQGAESKQSIEGRLAEAAAPLAEGLAALRRDLAASEESARGRGEAAAALHRERLESLAALRADFDVLRVEQAAGLAGVERAVERLTAGAAERDAQARADLTAACARIEAFLSARLGEMARGQIALWESQAEPVRRAAAELRQGMEPLAAALATRARADTALPEALASGAEQALRAALDQRLKPLLEGIFSLAHEFSSLKGRLGRAGEEYSSARGLERAAWERAAGLLERFRSDLDQRDKDRERAHARRQAELERTVTAFEERSRAYEEAWAQRLEQLDQRLAR